MFAKLIAYFMIFINMLGVWIFNWPAIPRGEELDLSKFTLTWQDEFDGDSLDFTKWRDHHNPQGEVTIRRGGYWHRDMAKVEDGLLKIETSYKEEGFAGGPEGYYTAGFDTNGLFEQKYGYFEISCKAPKGEGTWSAFWMLSEGMWNITGDGHSGAEIDVFESAYYSQKPPHNNAVSSTVHIDGYGDDHRSFFVGKYKVDKPYDTFNTYGLEWNEDEYIFYINGTETNRGTFGGVSRVPEYLLISVEFGGKNGIPDNDWAGDIRNNTHLPSFFEIEYVRVYQYNNLLD